MFLCQKKYASKVLESTGMRNYHSCKTPIDTESKLGADGPLVSILTLLELYSISPSLDLICLMRFIRQYTLSHSSVKAKYCGVANAVAEMFWLRNLLRELHSPLHSATIVYCDNDQVAKGQVHILNVPSRYQYANIFTKGLPSSLFEELHTSLSVLHPLALTRGL
ncbi:ribonuclease H-like domain-containing protein [Tanacetum coccineum]|uniref:Ribonuclease H-like domain-containing protein n=1 Tax=Tanacetum coccineum TaxID=301880 RepID=A0ABQ5ITS3_9ASTR